jgi:hypothetical protein
MSTEQNPNWHVTACVHHPITAAQADGLFDTLADAAHGWEPAGMDVDVSGGPCYCRESPAAVARVVDAAREVARVLRPAVSRPSRALVAAVDALDTDADPVVGTRPPWQVHDGPPPTHGTPAAEPAAGPGWDQDTIADLARCLRTFGYAPLTPGAGMVADQLDALLADRDRLGRMVEAMTATIRAVPDSHSAANLAHARAERNRLRTEVAEVTADRDRLRQRLADSIDPANIPDQRAKNWPDWHPEKYCHRCGRPNINWYADSAIWNEVHGGSGPIWCPACFARAYEQTTARRVSWRLAPVEKSDQLGHLIRSEAAMRHERDSARAELSTARRDAAADALLMVRRRFEESTTDGNIDTGWWLMWLEAWAAEVRTGQRTISPQSATTPDDLPEWERDIVFPATDTTEEP